MKFIAMDQLKRKLDALKNPGLDYQDGIVYDGIDAVIILYYAGIQFGTVYLRRGQFIVDQYYIDDDSCIASNKVFIEAKDIVDWVRDECEYRLDELIKDS